MMIRGAQIAGEAWKRGVADSKSSPCHQSTKSVSPSPSGLFFPTMGWEMGMLSPEHLPMSWEHIKLLKQSVSWCFFQPGFGGLDPRLVLRIGGSHFALEEVGERAMKLPSSSPKITPRPHNVARGQQEQPGSALPAAS